MIKYVALMKLMDETPVEQLKQIQDQLKVLGKTIGEVAKWSCGRCLDSPESSSRWTFVVVADFKDERAYQRYREHPEHKAFGEFIKPYRERAVGMHFEANYPYMGLIRHEGGVPVLIPMHRLPPLED